MLPFPFKLEDLKEEEIAHIEKKGFKTWGKLLRINPGGFLFNSPYLHLGPLLYNFQFRATDILQLSWPKSGTTWTLEILWAIMHPDQLHLMDQKSINERTFYLDKDFSRPMPLNDLDKFKKRCPKGKKEDGIMMQLAQEESSPRILWSHLPVNLHNPNILEICRVVYVARNPKDMMASIFHFLQAFHTEEETFFDGDFSDLVHSFIDGTFPLIGNYWEHFRLAWNLRHHRNFYFIFYEDMKKDIKGEIKKLSDFLRVNLNDEQINKIIEATTFSTMKERERILPVVDLLKTSMFRKGQIGDAKNIFTPDLENKVNAWIRKNTDDLDVKFQYQ